MYLQRHLAWLLVAMAALFAAAAPTTTTAASPSAAIITIDGAIGPATAEYVEASLNEAAERHAEVAILAIDTPGGLATSMRAIIKAILASEVPVIGYVSPSGARAASAGTYILYATHIAAMAPATNLGAATPVSIMGGSPASDDQSASGTKPESAEQRKILNDSVAYIEALAKRRDRNAEWAAKAVRDAASLTADEALKKNVINLIAPSVPALLSAIDGRMVVIGDASVTLHTNDIATYNIEPSWRIRFLDILSNPTLAYLLFLAGIAGLALEATHPGSVFPGVTGAICLLFALFAFQLLPVNYAGLGLILLGLGLMVAEAFVGAFGALGVGGVIAFILGSIMLMDTRVPGFGVNLAAIIGAGGTLSIGLLLVIIFAVRAHRRTIHSGREEMIGALAVAIDPFTETGQVRIRGEIWRARTRTAVQAGDTLRVTGMHALTLDVEPTDKD